MHRLFYSFCHKNHLNLIHLNYQLIFHYLMIKLSNVPLFNKCSSSSIVKKYRDISFLVLNILFNIYTIVIFLISLFQEQLLNIIIYGIISLILIGNVILFTRNTNLSIWKFILIVCISFVVIIHSSTFNFANYSSLIIVCIPLIAYSICDRKNASIITIFFFLISLIVFIQKLFLNYYNPESFLISLYVVILYTIVGGLTMFVFYVDLKKESYYENKLIVEKNENVTHNEIVKKYVHELRTSINNIIAITDFLEESISNPKQKEYLETIVTSINTILTSTKKLDVFSNKSKIIDEKEKLSFDFSTTIDEFTKLYANNKKDKQFFFTTNISRTIPKNLIGIPEKLKQILFNIFETISVNTESYKVDIDIAVSMNKETEENVHVLTEIHTSSIQVNALEVEFDKNYSRLHNYFSNRSIEIPDKDDKEYEENYSIILAKNIVNHLEGEIGIRFKDPNIIVFWVMLPLWKKRIEEKAIVKEKVKIADDKKEPKKELINSKILIVEDNHLNQRVLSLGLGEQVKTLDIANNGKEAIDMFSNNKYDLILMDLHLPIIDGFKATEKIREMEVGLNTHTPIIGLSAILMDGIEEQCKKAGLDEYISKPYNISKLKDRIEFYINS